MKALVLCLGCERHVMPNETACPFCGAAIAATAEPKRPPARGLSRAKLHAFHTAAIATSVAVAVACGGDNGPGTDASTDTTGNDVNSKDVTNDTSSTDATADVVAETGGGDASADVVDEDHVIPLPYGCVFPGGCKHVTV